MSKRAPETELNKRISEWLLMLERRQQVREKYSIADRLIRDIAESREHALVRERSHRVQLHRERAKCHQNAAAYASVKWATSRSDDDAAAWKRVRVRHEKAAARFHSRADKIERGEL